MELLPKHIRDRLPPIGSTESAPDPLAQVKFFHPASTWTWYATEFDGEDLFFGFVEGLEKEMGYFRLSELESVRGPLGLRIERDLHFDPTPMSVLHPCLYPLARVREGGDPEFAGVAKKDRSRGR